MNAASDKAKQVVAGSKWFNNGIRNFRLKPNDPNIQNLTPGKIKPVRNT